MTLIAWATWNGHHAHWWIWAPITWALLIAVVVLLVRRRTLASHPTDTARAILAERYARGEITVEEYRERLAALAS